MGLFDGLPKLDFGDPPRRPQRPRPAPDVDVVTWQSVHCPKCGSEDCPVIDSRQIPKRKHRCHCGHEFWSYETNHRPADATD